MIKTKTLLILGAGASQPYEFPLGDQLCEKIIDKLRGRGFQEKVINELSILPAAGEMLIENFRIDLGRFKPRSIDQFLTRQEPRLRLIGKLAVASIILECEHPRHFNTTQKNWYLELYKILSRDATLENFGNNSLSVITFNYDRSLEHFLYVKLIGDYGENKKELIKKQLGNIPIVHMHGRLPALPWESSHGLDYGTRADYVNLSLASAGIEIMGENDSASVEAENLLKNTQNIYFLGFGYHQSNLNKLNLETINICPNVSGTCFGESAHNQDSIKDYFGKRIGLTGMGCDVFQFIQTHFTPDRNSQPSMRMLETTSYGQE
jgi:hypothetical protein